MAPLAIQILFSVLSNCVFGYLSANRGGIDGLKVQCDGCRPLLFHFNHPTFPNERISLKKSVLANSRLSSAGNSVTKRPFRVGHGFDIHKIVKSDEKASPELTNLVIGCLMFPEYKVVAHSDGDVILHGITEALLGAMGLQDIGDYFPNTDPRWHNADSCIFVKEALKEVTGNGYYLSNIDVSVIAETPKLGKKKLIIKKNVSELLNIPLDCVAIKSRTFEGLDSIGKGNAVACHVIASLLPV